MSKLSQQINAVIQNKRAINSEPLTFADFSLEYSSNKIAYPDYEQQVAFTGTFGCKYFIDEKLAHKNSDALVETLKNVRRSVVEEIFGEFRLPLRELRHYLLSRDYYAAEKVLNKLEEQMFNV